MRLRDLTDEHLGRPVYGVKGIAGWERHLLLTGVEHQPDGTTRLDFRWNDDPSPANTKRGQWAVGAARPSDDPCSLAPTEGQADE